jgi:hypothetical protein
MKLSETLLTEHRERARELLESSKEKLKGARSDAERRMLVQSIRDSEKRLETLDVIVQRNVFYLDIVERSVFVSTRFESAGTFPPWLQRSLDRVNALADRSRCRFQFTTGVAHVPGASFFQAIHQNLLESACFLLVIGARQRRKTTPDLSRYVLAEAGAAYAVAKPMVIAVERSVQLGDRIPFAQREFEYVAFERGNDGETLENFPVKLREALEKAPNLQKMALQDRLARLQRVFGNY